MPEALTTAVAAITLDSARSQIRRLVDGAAEVLTKQAGHLARSLVDNIIVSLRSSFTPYLESSFNRCKQFKTILNPQQPLSIVDHYVHITLSCGRRKFADQSFLKEVDARKYVIIKGLAGSGKSVFMKYLVLKYFEFSARIPLFIDLRNLNAIAEKNLITFIRIHCSGIQPTLTEDQFAICLKRPIFALILDGFDELNHEFRDDIQKQILDIEKKFPETHIVVSSRPDDRFNSWGAFHLFSVDRLNKEQCIELIRSLDYDAGVKTRFIKEVSTRLFDTHESFLSSPLLTTIMLLTYEEFANIPDKMHAFYGQAFDTLFQKHDAHKEQYQRKTHTGLPRGEFRACFAAFSAISYLEQSFSFTEDRLVETATKALDYARQAHKNIGTGVTATQLVDDLKESVCMLQPDGLEIAFVHRSFQEYFAAVFATSVHGPKMKTILDRYSLRIGDSVVLMALDMERQAIEQAWVLPTINHLSSLLDIDNRSVNNAERYCRCFPQIDFHVGHETLLFGFSHANMEIIGPLEVLRRAYSEQMKNFRFPFLTDITLATAQKMLIVEEYKKHQNYHKVISAITPKEKKRGRSPSLTGAMRHTMFKITRQDEWWLEALGLSRMFYHLKRGLNAIRREINAGENKRNIILHDLLPGQAGNSTAANQHPLD